MSRRAKSAFWGLFAAETAGLAALLGLGIPLYRRLLSGPGGERPGGPVVWLVLPLVVLMQAACWTKRRFAPAVTLPRHDVLGHVVLFLARLSFVFAGSWFSVVFFVRSSDTKGSALGIAVLLASLFSVFCYVFELERLARLSLGLERAGAK